MEVRFKKRKKKKKEKKKEKRRKKRQFHTHVPVHSNCQRTTKDVIIYTDLLARPSGLDCIITVNKTQKCPVHFFLS